MVRLIEEAAVTALWESNTLQSNIPELVGGGGEENHLQRNDPELSKPHAEDRREGTPLCRNAGDVLF